MIRVRDDLKQQILDRNDIVEVIAEHLTLRPAGSRFKALCPFHKEKTPSFIVSPDRQMFHCFGCHVGGDVIRFIQLFENLDFPGALEYLARRAGVRLEYQQQDEKPQVVTDYSLLEEVLRFYQQALKKTENPAVRSLLKNRGLNDNLVNLFQLGYADPAWDSLMTHFRRKEVGMERLAALGLLTESSPGQYRDLFRDRLMFPIFTASGQVVAFGGRAVGEQMPKYLNSPETERFKKGRMLYALNLAKKALREKKSALLAEGYMDVVALHRAGFTHSVGSLGTALTEEQVRLLKRYVERCYLVYDGDEAGRKAALRAVDLFRDQDLPCRVVQLPDGCDPDDFLRQHSSQALQDLLEKAPDAFDFRMEWACGQRDVESLEGRRAVAREIGQWILRVPSEMARTEYWGRLSERLGTPVAVLQREVPPKTLRPRQTHLEDPSAGGSPAVARRVSQEQIAKQGLVALLLDSGEYLAPIREFWSSLEPVVVDEDPYDRLIPRLIELAGQQKSFDADSLRSALVSEGFSSHLSEVLLGDPIPENREKALREYLATIRKHRLVRQTREASEKLKKGILQPDRCSHELDVLFQLQRERYRLGESR